ncbi:hypothetical protein F5Y05DRAFT_65599 [Hypoxylon sp. FL0543]|nr:hypothetical protein F5Y05DRAFT_65599 [Hypoxylon sp. FL0543]
MSFKTLIRKLFRATVLIRVDIMSTREREVIDLTAPSREPSVEPALASSSTLVGVEKDGSERERSRTLSLPREVTPDLDNPRSDSTPELPEAPATPRDKEPRRSLSPVVARVQVEVVGSPIGAAATAEASSSTTVIELPTTPKSDGKANAAASNNTKSSLSARKRHPDTSGFRVIVKEEPRDYDDRPPSPIEGYPAIIKPEDDDDDDDDDPFEISPKKPRGSPDINLSVIPFGRSSTPSPSPRAAPVYHPDFPDRPALRCPNQIRDHFIVEREVSNSSRNHGRLYFSCSDCKAAKKSSFICWADPRLTWAEGRNDRYPHQPRWPRCWCGRPAREDISGDYAQSPDTLWYKCATDACKFRRYDRHDPLSHEEVNMYSGRQVY